MPNSMPDWFRGTAEGQRIAQEERTNKEARRRTLRDAIATRERALVAALPSLKKRLDPALAERDKRKAAYDAAQIAANVIAVEEHDLRHAETHARSVDERELREGADPAIAAFRAELQRADDELRGRGVALGLDASPWPHAHLARVLELIRRTAREDCGALELEVSLDASAQIAALRQRIRDVAHGSPSPVGSSGALAQVA